MNKFIEWKKLPGSIRFENAEIACDVWSVMEKLRNNVLGTSTDYLVEQYRFTVYDRIHKTYIDRGIELTEDDACEKAMEIAKI
jgi:hypothetical protein